MAVRTVSVIQPKLLRMDDWVRHPAADQYELIDGVLRPRMVNQNQHEFAVMRLGYILSRSFEQTQIIAGVFGSNTKYQVRSRRGIMPDLSVVLGTKVEQMDPTAAYNTVGPDLAIEVLSPEQDEEYIEERLGDYWKLGTTEAWSVDPQLWTVTGYARGEHEFKVFGTARQDEEFTSRLLPGLSFSVGSLWMRRR